MGNESPTVALADIEPPIATISDVPHRTPLAWRAVPATRSDRLLAKMIDMMLLGVCGFFTFIIGESTGIVPALVVLLLILGFALGFDLSPGGSPGVRCLDLLIWTPEGESPSFGQRLARVLMRSGPGYAAGFMVLAHVATNTQPNLGLFGAMIVGQIGFSFTAFVGVMATRRPLHDMLSGTVVGSVQLAPAQQLRAFEIIPVTSRVMTPEGG